MSYPAADLTSHLPAAKLREPAILLTLLLIFPATMSIPSGGLGVWLSAAVCIAGMIGLVRLELSSVEFRMFAPWRLGIVLLLATMLAFMREEFRAELLRGVPLHWAAFLITTTYAALWQRRLGQPQQWMNWFLLLASGVSLIAIGEYVTKLYLPLDLALTQLTGVAFDNSAYYRSAHDFRSLSTLGNALLLSTVCSVAAVYAFAQNLQAPRIVYLLAFGLNTGAVFASKSRSAWIAQAAGIVAVLLFTRLRKVKPAHLFQLLALILPLCVLLLNPASYVNLQQSVEEEFEDVRNRFSFMEDSLSYEHRTAIIPEALAHMVTHPYTFLAGFGIGGENEFFLQGRGVALTNDIRRDAIAIRTFDNTYMTLFFCAGAIGLWWMLQRLFVVMKDSWRFRREIPAWYPAVIVNLAICIYFYNVMGAPAPAYCFTFLLALDPRLLRRHIVAGSATPVVIMVDNVENAIPSVAVK
jgi:hypothetical protein